MFINYLISTTIETFALIAVAVTYPINVVKWDPKPCQNCAQTPILMVHGYLHNSSAWLYIRHQLQKAGYRSIYTINLGSPFQSIEDYGKKIQQKIQQIKQETGADTIRLIGHSMGGIVVSYYATELAPPGEVESVVTIGAPLQGTTVAYIGIGQSARQMRPGSPFIRALNQKILASENIRWLHIGSDTDLIIRPASSATMSHAHSSCLIYKRMGHAAMLYSPDVAHKILQFYVNHKEK